MKVTNCLHNKYRNQLSTKKYTLRGIGDEIQVLHFYIVNPCSLSAFVF